MRSLPAPLREVSERLARLPGLGRKSALRAALHLLAVDRSQADALGRAILEMREKLCFCARCNSLSECDPCCVCSDPQREDNELMVVPDLDSLLAVEEGGFYRGRYLVLGGLLAPLDDVAPEGLQFGLLSRRLAEGGVDELILALGATLEAEATASYIKNLAEERFPQVNVSRLAQGIPLGAEVKFMDRETLRQSLRHRQKI